MNRYPHNNIHQALVKLMIHQVNEVVFLLEKTETRFRNDDWHYLRARCYAKSGELFLALEQMLKIRNHFERRFHSYFFDLKDNARKVYFLDRHPTKHCDKKIQQELIWAYQNLGENDPVIQLYEELIEKYPQIVEII